MGPCCPKFTFIADDGSLLPEILKIIILEDSMFCFLNYTFCFLNYSWTTTNCWWTEWGPPPTVDGLSEDHHQLLMDWLRTTNNCWWAEWGPPTTVDGLSEDRHQLLMDRLRTTTNCSFLISITDVSVRGNLKCKIIDKINYKEWNIFFNLFNFNLYFLSAINNKCNAWKIKILN